MQKASCRRMSSTSRDCVQFKSSFRVQNGTIFSFSHSHFIFMIRKFPFYLEECMWKHTKVLIHHLQKHFWSRRERREYKESRYYALRVQAMQIYELLVWLCVSLWCNSSNFPMNAALVGLVGKSSSLCCLLNVSHGVMRKSNERRGLNVEWTSSPASARSMSEREKQLWNNTNNRAKEIKFSLSLGEQSVSREYERMLLFA